MRLSRPLKALLIVLGLSALILLASTIYKKYFYQEPLDLKDTGVAKTSVLDQLPLKEQEITSASPNDLGIYVWPSASVLPDYHQTNLLAYQGRSLDQKPLKGIWIFLDAGHGGTDDGLLAYSENGEVIAKEKDITLAVAELLKKRLEELGARVSMIRTGDVYLSTDARIAYVNNLLINQFLAEIKEQKFQSKRLEDLSLVMEKLINSNTEEEHKLESNIFRTKGVSPDLRLLLDLQKQYQDVLLISLHTSSSDDNTYRGARFFYYGESEAKKNGAEELDKNNLAEQPAYTSYQTRQRRLLSEHMLRNITGLAPYLIYSGGEGNEATIVEANYPLLSRLNLNSVRIELGFINQTADLAVLQEEEKQKTIAEAIAHSCFNFYCQH